MEERKEMEKGKKTRKGKENAERFPLWFLDTGFQTSAPVLMCLPEVSKLVARGCHLGIYSFCPLGLIGGMIWSFTTCGGDLLGKMLMFLLLQALSLSLLVCVCV